ncbi:hypothetical protein H5410_018094, partial [Solanum commersonii]
MKRGRVNARLEVWRQALEAKGLRLSRTKRIFEVQIGDVVEADVEVRLATRSFLRESFKYLGAVIQEVVTSMRMSHIAWGCLDEMEACLRVLCDKKIPSRLKAVLAVKNACPKMHVSEMKMLRWMCGHTRSDKIRNEVIREKVGVASVVDKLREARPKWFGHVKRQEPQRRGRGRPKKYWGEVIRQGLGSPSPYQDMTQIGRSGGRVLRLK